MSTTKEFLAGFADGWRAFWWFSKAQNWKALMPELRAEWSRLAPSYCRTDDGFWATLKHSWLETWHGFFAPLWMIAWLVWQPLKKAWERGRQRKHPSPQQSARH